jgi:hypothetical protein
MSSTDNKAIVKKTQEILKEQGYDIKLSHVYELFSKLSGVKDWNSAKALDKDFGQLVNKEIQINEEYRELHFLVNIGDSGDCYFMPNTVSNKTIHIIKSEIQLKLFLDSVEEEMNYRKNMINFDKNKFSRIFINFGHISSLPEESKIFPFKNQIIELLKKAREVGILIFMQTSKASSSDVPEEIKSQIVHKELFKVPKTFIAKMGTNTRKPFKLGLLSSNLKKFTE